MNSEFCLCTVNPCDVTVHALGKKKKKRRRSIQTAPMSFVVLRAVRNNLRISKPIISAFVL